MQYFSQCRLPVFFKALMLALSFIYLACVYPVFADSHKKANSDQPVFTLPEDLDEKKQMLNILKKQLRSIAAELLSDLSSSELQIIYDIRTDYGVVQSVRHTRHDITKAVESCLENNEGLDDLAQSFDKWNEQIDPIIKTSKERILKEINNQGIVDPDKFEVYLLTVDTIVRVQDSLIDKIYITDKKACQNMQAKLQTTKEGLASLLQDTLDR